MTEAEAAEFYSHTLRLLEGLGASDLSHEIQLTVARGAFQTKPSGRRETLRSLSPQEAILTALRMLLAAIEPVFQIHHAEITLNTTIDWRFDELESTFANDSPPNHLPDSHASRLGIPERSKLADDDLNILYNSVAQLFEMMRELEGENADAL